MTPRPYQADAIRANLRFLERYDSVLNVMATGTGKTVVFCNIIKDVVSRGKRAMIIAHREELIFQARQKVREICGISADIEMAEYRADMFYRSKSPVVIASIDTLVSRMGDQRRMHKFPPPDFELVIIDEAHHAVNRKYRRVIDYFRAGGSKIDGFTATADRLDGVSLGSVFDRVAETDHGAAYQYELNQAIIDGWLVPVVPHRIRVTGLDFSGCKPGRELSLKDQARALEYEAPLQEMVGAIIDRAGDRKTLIFAATLAQADRMSEIIERHRDGCVRFVHGQTPKDERRQMFIDYRKSRFQFLVNVGVTIEGFDEPSIAVVALCRMTKSRSLLCQMCGRGTRPLDGIVDAVSGGDPDTQAILGFEGSTDPAAIRRRLIAESAKPSVEIIDFVGNCGRHYLMSPFDIFAGNYSDAVIRRARRMKRADRNGDATDLIERLEAAKRADEAEQQRRAARRSIGVAKVSYTVQYVDPFDPVKFAPDAPTKGRSDKPASSAQLDRLLRWGIPAKTLRGFSMKQASKMMGRLIVRQKRRLCTPKVSRIMLRHGFDPDMAAVRAKPIVDVLSRHGWRWPPHLPRPNPDGTPGKAVVQTDRPEAGPAGPNEPAPWPW